MTWKSVESVGFILVLAMLAYAAISYGAPVQKIGTASVIGISQKPPAVSIQNMAASVQQSEDIRVGYVTYGLYFQVVSQEPVAIHLSRFIVNAHKDPSLNYVNAYVNGTTLEYIPISNVSMGQGAATCFGDQEVPPTPGHTDCPEGRIVFADPGRYYSGANHAGGAKFGGLVGHCTIFDQYGKVYEFGNPDVHPDYNRNPQGTILLPDVAIEYSLVNSGKAATQISYLGDINAPCASWLAQ